MSSVPQRMAVCVSHVSLWVSLKSPRENHDFHVLIDKSFTRNVRSCRFLHRRFSGCKFPDSGQFNLYRSTLFDDFVNPSLV